MKILFITNLPSPYRVSFFNELGKQCALTVCFERHSAADRDSKWVNRDQKNFREIYAKVTPVGADQSRGNGIVEVIKQEEFDHLIITGYASPAVMRAIAYCRRHKIPYYIESDGAFYQKDRFPKNIVKKYLLCGAKAHFTTCEEHIRYLNSLGISRERINKYYFTSLAQSDILAEPLNVAEKANIRQTLGMTEKNVVLSVGQFIHRKGYDVLLNACQSLPSTVGVYIVGGTPTDEYLSLKETYKLDHVHFVDFMTKEQLKQWYFAADCFVLPTREDVWGLVINEAMAYGLPIITTDHCIAGLELVTNGENGYIIPVENAEILSEKINLIINSDQVLENMGRSSIEKIQWYTFENMAKVHMDYLKGYGIDEK